MNINFSVEGKPVGKERPRKGRHGFYTPHKTQDYEEYVRTCYRQEAHGRFFKSGVHAIINVTVSVPKHLSKKRKEELIGKRANGRPDLDNVAKSILDALNGVAYLDDKQVNALVVARYYGEKNNVEVALWDSE